MNIKDWIKTISTNRMCHTSTHTNTHGTHTRHEHGAKVVRINPPQQHTNTAKTHHKFAEVVKIGCK